ncbi:hypothetical protein [Fictibacillus arsenicus]|uniref:Uncharacterized protein n=1 Tax=Fictibacillus arsenicus TaxID=255247 RepID=A0A1V3G7T8_9BACL|nr:hypothetical protein [Fictibacillus arsenicus]OOE12460.1 hypothetical protein UN64_10235 [Fictibacillus arsenicus]
MRKFLLLALLYVFIGTSLFPNYNMKNLSSPPQNDVFELSSAASYDASTIIGEYPTKSKKLKKGLVDIQLNSSILMLKQPEFNFEPSRDHIHKEAVFLTPYQFQSNYL